MAHQTLPRDLAERIYDILVEHAGAPESDRAPFLDYYCSQRPRSWGPTEFRCCHRWGFAGKFWWANCRFYVSGHSRGDNVGEKVLEREAREIAAVNRKLGILYEEFAKRRQAGEA